MFKGRLDVCYICGEPNDRNGNHCRACHRLIPRGYNSMTLEVLGRIKALVTVKRKCLGCENIQKCLLIQMWKEPEDVLASIPGMEMDTVGV